MIEKTPELQRYGVATEKLVVSRQKQKNNISLRVLRAATRYLISQEIALLDLDAMKTFERAQFEEHQNTRRAEAAKALESGIEKVIDLFRHSPT